MKQLFDIYPFTLHCWCLDDITIREGEGFLLPARVAHSPQRFANTIGLVIERERQPSELDCLRWYTSLDSNESSILFERWFHCYDLSQLNALIQQFTSSREFIVGQPGPGSFLRKALFEEPSNVKIHPPISLRDASVMHLSRKIMATGNTDADEQADQCTASSSVISLSRYVFDDPQFSSTVMLYGPGKHAILLRSGCDLFLFQLVSCSPLSLPLPLAIFNVFLIYIFAFNGTPFHWSSLSASLLFLYDVDVRVARPLGRRTERGRLSADLSTPLTA